MGGCRRDLTSLLHLLHPFPLPSDQDLVSEPPDEAQEAAAGAEAGGFLRRPPALRTPERRGVLASHLRGPAASSAPARGRLRGLRFSSAAGTHPGPQQRLQSTARLLLGSALLCRL